MHVTTIYRRIYFAWFLAKQNISSPVDKLVKLKESRTYSILCTELNRADQNAHCSNNEETTVRLRIFFC